MVGNESISSEKKRIAWMDIFRGYGIILMIMGHVEFGSRFDFFIHAFHMPMFFFISGYFFSNKNISTLDFIKKKAKALLLPYIVWGGSGYLIWLCYHEKSIIPLYHLLYNNTEGLPIVGALWFLSALFLTEVIYFVIDRYVKNIVEKNCLIILIAIFGTIATNLLPIRLPYAMDAAFVGVGLFHVGHTMHAKKNTYVVDSLLNLNFKVWLVLSILCCAFIFRNGYVNMRTGDYGVLAWFWFNAIFAIVIGINFSKLSEMLGKIMNPIMKIGKNSITYVCLNQVVIYFLRKGFNFINNGKVFTGMKMYIEHFVMLICTILILYVLDWILNSNKLTKKLIGR